MKIKRDQRIKALLHWFTLHGRTLPWRDIDDPYKIFVSEIMLQQTQANRVIDFYTSWLKTFPTWKALADAKTPKLLKAWAGLGYNRRALYLRESARHVIQNRIPKTQAEWQTLKGVGPYTAGAVFAFTSKTPTATIDTNIRRVIGRSMLGLSLPALEDDSRILKALKKSLTHKDDWLSLHALMDLGAMICSPRSPQCSICPLERYCKATKKLQTNQPHKKLSAKKTVRETIHEGKKFPDRIYRGRILKLVRDKKNISIHRIGNMIDETFNQEKDLDWLLRMIDRMKKDGFIEVKKNILSITQT